VHAKAFERGMCNYRMRRRIIDIGAAPRKIENKKESFNLAFDGVNSEIFSKFLGPQSLGEYKARLDRFYSGGWDISLYQQKAAFNDTNTLIEYLYRDINDDIAIARPLFLYPRVDLLFGPSMEVISIQKGGLTVNISAKYIDDQLTGVNRSARDIIAAGGIPEIPVVSFDDLYNDIRTGTFDYVGRNARFIIKDYPYKIHDVGDSFDGYIVSPLDQKIDGYAITSVPVDIKYQTYANYNIKRRFNVKRAPMSHCVPLIDDNFIDYIFPQLTDIGQEFKQYRQLSRKPDDLKFADMYTLTKRY
jgi:hypothetical protein